ncbi:MAG: hypothetical protein VB142_04115 [Burkholderia sp.]
MLDFPRTTIYAERARALSNVAHSLLQWDGAGPQPKMSDHELLEAICADLARTPFVGEGARKGMGAPAHPGRHPRVPSPCLAA